MGSIFSGLFGGGEKESSYIPPPKDTAATKAQAEALRKRQGGGLATQTSTSGFRQMIEASGGLKPTLGA